MRRIAGLAALALLAAEPALAQNMLGRSGAVRPENNREAPRAPIPGLPGLMGRQNIAPIPAEVPPASMNPNDALFDGINRGDMATVRDAVARGADVGARNALGLTALESAVDQARSEIMFYLLSVRGAATNAGAPDQAAPPRGRRPPTTREERAAALREERSGNAREERSGSAREERDAGNRRGAAPAEASPARQLPVLWAGNGGAPQPELGFLGFDAGRPDGARPEPPRGDAGRPVRRTARQG
jgi:hypothetical protein